MALNVTRGAVNTNINTTTIIRDVDPKVFFLQAAIAPLIGFLKKMKRGEKANNYKYEWIEKDQGTPLTTADGGETDSATELDVAAGAGVMFTGGDLLWIPATGEQISVTSVSTDKLTIVRAYGETAAAAIPNGTTVVKLGSAFAEGTTSPTGISLNPTIPYNLTQIFKTAAECTRTEAQTDRYDVKNPKMTERRNEAMILHLEEMERAYLFGELKLDISGSTPRHVGRGFKKWITTNVHNCSGSFTKAKFDAFMSAIFLYGGTNKVLLASSGMLDAIHAEVLGNSNMNIEPKTKEWGLSITRYRSPYGDIDIVYHRLLSQVLDGYGFAVDLDCIKERSLQNTRVKMNVAANDYDGFKDEILTEAHIQLMLEKKHGIIYNP
jgi:hypothetical protein